MVWPRQVPQLGIHYLTSGGDSLGSMPFTCCSCWYMLFTGMLDGVSLSLGVALYQYMTFAIEQRSLTAILLTVQWHCSAMPLTSGTWVLQCRICMTHLSVKARKVWLQKAGPLSVSISAGTLHSKTDFSCRTMTVKCVGLQLVSVKNPFPLLFCYLVVE